MQALGKGGVRRPGVLILGCTGVLGGVPLLISLHPAPHPSYCTLPPCRMGRSGCFKSREQFSPPHPPATANLWSLKAGFCETGETFRVDLYRNIPRRRRMINQAT